MASWYWLWVTLFIGSLVFGCVCDGGSLGFGCMCDGGSLVFSVCVMVAAWFSGVCVMVAAWFLGVCDGGSLVLGVCVMGAAWFSGPRVRGEPQEDAALVLPPGCPGAAGNPPILLWLREDREQQFQTEVVFAARGR